MWYKNKTPPNVSSVQNLNEIKWAVYQEEPFILGYLVNAIFSTYSQRTLTTLLSNTWPADLWMAYSCCQVDKHYICHLCLWNRACQSNLNVSVQATSQLKLAPVPSKIIIVQRWMLYVLPFFQVFRRGTLKIFKEKLKSVGNRGQHRK